MNKIDNKKAFLATSQVLILIVGLFAFAYILSSEVGFVKADGDVVGETSQKAGEISTTVGAATGLANAVKKDGPLSFVSRVYSINRSENGGAANPIDSLGAGAAWGATAGAIAYVGGSLLGVDDTTRNAASLAAAAGFGIGRAASALLPESWALAGWGLGLAVGIGIFLLMNKKEKTEIVRFECLPWDAKTGGNDCAKCNNQGILPCSQYQCKALGQGCELVNDGTDNQECVWINRNDVEPPVLTPSVNALLPDYKYTPDNTISPPDRGTFIVSSQTTSGCVKAFTPVQFGVNVNEPAKCKLDYERKPFEDMKFFFGGNSLLLRNHTQVLSLPGPSVEGNLTIGSEGDYNLYVTCEDANGNANENEFVFKFCVDDGPDTTPPLIVTTNLLNNMPVSYNTTSLNISAYINEPAQCRWSRLDQEYDAMENQMSCSTSVFEMNAQMLYECATTLTGLKDNFENNYFFRCKDQPIGVADSKRNPNLESYKFNVLGTQPLVISDVGPNGTISDATNVVRVELTAETSAGYKEGGANCYYSETNEDDSFILFNSDRNYDNHEHSQELFLEEGDYDLFVKCIDLGGNSDTEEISFSVESDNEEPVVTRIYRDSDGDLKVLTDEAAECVYGRDSCNYLFDDGTVMSSLDSEAMEHSVDWNTNVDFYIKCRDKFGNQPLPNQCSIIARPFSVSSSVTEE